jgi:hypothetical protein
MMKRRAQFARDDARLRSDPGSAGSPRLNAGENCGLLVTGAGLLSKRICWDLPLAQKGACSVVIAARSSPRLTETVHVANIRSAEAGSGVTFQGRVVDWKSASCIDDLLGSLKPRVILHTSSLQSPWELLDPKSGWSRFVSRAGFGVTLPLQAALALKIARSVKRNNLGSIVINACYPDCVNAVIHQWGLPIHLGIGNVAILAALLKAAFREQHGRVRVIAHHYHLSSLISQKGNIPVSSRPLVWVDESRTNVAPSFYKPLKQIMGAELNHVTSCTSLSAIAAFLDGSNVSTHAPGPLGLVGGYPVTLSEGCVTVCLPETLPLPDAIQWNRVGARLDGVEVIDDNVAFSRRAYDVLRTETETVPQCFPVSQIEDVSKELVAVRARLH